MKQSRPFFSIVMPTRNRAYLLRYALQSALEQTFGDYEIVVSNNHSDDNTEQVVRELADDRIQYVCTDRVLSMPDSWEFALTRARGEWVTFLADDDAICSDALERIVEVVEKSPSRLVSWDRAVYFHDTWPYTELRNVIAIYPHSGRTVEQDSATRLAHLFSFRKLRGLPRMLDSCCHRELLHRARQIAGRVFLPSCPDYSSCALLLSLVEKYSYLDMPLALTGSAPESTGRSVASSVSFVQEFQGETLFQCVPLSTRVVYNFVADSLLRVKEACPMHLSFIRLDWSEYYALCYSTILVSEPGFVAKAQDKKELLAMVCKQPARFRARVYMLTLRSWPRQWVRKAILRSPRLLSLTFWLLGGRVIRGKEVGFSNALEAVRYLATHSPGRYPSDLGSEKA